MSRFDNDDELFSDEADDLGGEPRMLFDERCQFRSTPPHNSQQSSDDEEDQANPPGPNSSFQDAFRGTRPHYSPPSTPARPRTPRRKIRQSIRQYWDENVSESLKTFSIPLESIFDPVCMTPTKAQAATMAARSKCMELLAQDHPSLLSGPNKGMPLCFLARAAEGLPIHIQKVLFFFTSVANSILDLGHFAAPTPSTDVVHDRVDPKVIRRLVSSGLGMAPDDSTDDESRAARDEFVCTSDILKSRGRERPSETREPVPPLSIHVAFTGAVFNEQEGKERREVFCALFVTPSDNFALMSYVLDSFLKKPKMGTQKYEQLMELYLESSSFFREIMRYECFHNLAADERELGLPEDYLYEPGGKLGMSTVLSPFQIPLKIFNLIRGEHPNADLSSIRIVGCPELTFQRSDDYTKAWLDYMRMSINDDAKRQEALASATSRYSTCKEKAEFDRIPISASAGWPLEVNEADGTVTCFGLPPLPLMHKFDTNGARGNFSVFIASIGDADQALPDLTRAILTSFLVHSSDVNTRPEIEHLLKDKRKANPLLVLRTYYGPDADPFSALVLANRQRMWAEALRSDIQVQPLSLQSSEDAATDQLWPAADAPIEGGLDPGGPSHHQGLPGKRGQKPGEHDRVPGLQERHGDPDEGRVRSHAV